MVKIRLGLAAALLLAGCNRGIDNQEAVRQGVIDYLATRSNLNVSGMNVTVASVSFRKDEADALISFSPKGANPGQGMSMRYTLARRGNKWVVKDKAERGANPHGGVMTQPPGPGGAGALPPGHPSVEQPSPKK